MATVAEKQAWLSKLERARASGVLEVEDGEERLRYRSLPEMDTIIASLRQEIAQDQGASRPAMSLRVVTTKGL